MEGKTTKATPKKRTARKPKLEYKQMNKFESFEDFEIWWKQERSGLEKDHSYRTSEGEEVDYYRCSSRGCGFRAKVVFCAYEPTVTYHISEVPHNPEAHVATTRVTPAVKRRVKELFDEDFQPKRIRETLLQEMEDDTKVPTVIQIEGICQRLKTEAAQPTVITMEDLEIISYIAEKSKEPVDDNSVFVVGSTPYKRQGDFCIVWSTKSLMEIQSKSEYLAINGISNMTWQGHVILFAGTYVGSIFRPVYLTLISRIHKNPISELFKIIASKQSKPLKFVQSEVSPVITECCQWVFPEARRLHDVREVSKDMEARVVKSVESVENIEAIRRDITILGFALSDEQFNNVSAKAVDRWRELGVTEPVLDQFTTSWLSSPNCYWYQGSSPFPVTCEALESEFHAIKRVHALREKMKFEFFQKWLYKTIQVDWIESKDLIGTGIPQPVYSEAYNLSLYSRPITGIEGTEEFLIPSESAGKIKMDEGFIVSLYSSTYTSFEYYVKTRFQVYHLRKTGPKTFSCTCKFGSMKKPCKHAVYLACSLKLDYYPEDDNTSGTGVEVIHVEPR